MSEENFTEVQKANYSVRFKACESGEEAQKLALEYYRKAANVNANGSSGKNYADVYRTVFNSDNKYYTTLKSAFDELTFDEKIKFCAKACVAEYNNTDHKRDFQVISKDFLTFHDKWNVPENVSPETLKDIETIVSTFGKEDIYDFKKNIYPAIKNNENLSPALRADVNNTLMTYRHAGMRGELAALKPQFHTLETVKAADWNAQNAPALADVISYWADKAPRYTATKTPTATKTFADNKDLQQLDPAIVGAVQKQLVRQDLMNGHNIGEIKADLPANAADRIIASALIDVANKSAERDELISKIDDKELLNLRCILINGQPRVCTDKNESLTYQKMEDLLLAQYVFSDKRQLSDFQTDNANGAPSVDYNKLGEIAGLSGNDSAEIREKSLKLLTDIKDRFLSDPDVAKAQKIKKESDIIDTKVQMFREQQQAKYGALNEIENLQRSARKLMESWPSEDKCSGDFKQINPQIINEAVANALQNDKEVALVAPTIKKPNKLVGFLQKDKIQDAENKQNMLNEAVKQLNEGLNNAVKKPQTKEYLQTMGGDLWNDSAVHNIRFQLNNAEAPAYHPLKAWADEKLNSLGENVEQLDSYISRANTNKRYAEKAEEIRAAEQAKSAENSNKTEEKPANINLGQNQYKGHER
jgi:hypothetical protein